jgi:hypothetical protein
MDRSSNADGYELQFLFRNSANAEVRVPFFRDISTGDLEKLLARVRDFGPHSSSRITPRS